MKQFSLLLYTKRLIFLRWKLAISVPRIKEGWNGGGGAKISGSHLKQPTPPPPLSTCMNWWNNS